MPKVLPVDPVASGLGPAALTGNRFVTHVSIVRVNQIKVSPDRSIGDDESADNTVDKVRARRDAFLRGCPHGRMTWGLTRLALKDQRQQYKDVRRLLAEYHNQYGDEITFHPGGYFVPMYNKREDIRRDIHEGLRLISKMVGAGYRPQSLVAGFMDTENQRLLASDEGINVCQGRSGASMRSTMATVTAESAIRTIPVVNTI